MNKLVSRNKLPEIINELKKQNKKVVLAGGCFDVLHVGHIRYLEESKSLGDILIVGINGDDAVFKLKGAGRPYTNALERAEILSALFFVDYVVIYEETTTKHLIAELKPNIYAKGTDYTSDTVPWHDIVESYGGKVMIVGDEKTHSSTEIIDRVRGKNA